MNAKTQRAIRFVFILALLTALTVATSGCYDSGGYNSDKDPFWWGDSAPVEKHTDQNPRVALVSNFDK